MKLPIKKKYFDEIKAGKKVIEYREAHITFICEETGEKLRKEVTHTEVVRKKEVPKEYYDVVTEGWAIRFDL